MYLNNVSCALGEAGFESGYDPTEANTLQHWRCDESDDKVAGARLVPDYRGVTSCEDLYLLHPVCTCADRCACISVSALVNLVALNWSTPSDLPFDLIDRGKISAISVQLTGPIPYAKLAISIAGQPWKHVSR